MTLLLLLAACGKQENVDAIPANLADDMPAPIAPVADEEALSASKVANTPYSNAQRGFSIALPSGWIVDDAKSGRDEIVAHAPDSTADLRVAWSANTSGADFAAIKETMRDVSANATGVVSTDTEYRATTSDDEGNVVTVRALVKTDGSLVSANIVYPQSDNDTYEQLAKTALESLRVFVPTASEAGAAATTPADNAAVPQ